MTNNRGSKTGGTTGTNQHGVKGVSKRRDGAGGSRAAAARAAEATWSGCVTPAGLVEPGSVVTLEGGTRWVVAAVDPLDGLSAQQVGGAGRSEWLNPDEVQRVRTADEHSLTLAQAVEDADTWDEHFAPLAEKGKPRTATSNTGQTDEMAAEYQREVSGGDTNVLTAQQSPAIVAATEVATSFRKLRTPQARMKAVTSDDDSNRRVESWVNKVLAAGGSQSYDLDASEEAFADGTAAKAVWAGFARLDDGELTITDVGRAMYDDDSEMEVFWTVNTEPQAQFRLSSDSKTRSRQGPPEGGVSATPAESVAMGEMMAAEKKLSNKLPEVGDTLRLVNDFGDNYQTEVTHVEGAYVWHREGGPDRAPTGLDLQSVMSIWVSW